MKGVGVSHGAITVMNAIPCGIGATIGVDMITRAVFEEGGTEKVVHISGNPGEDDTAARLCVSAAYDLAGVEEPEGWRLTTESDIPVSRGLKSSSAACNAVLRAVTDLLDLRIDTVELIRTGVGCAMKAGVTVTGAFDDACGCGMEGLVMTDNDSNKMLGRSDIGEHDVVIHVPGKMIRKTGLPLEALRARGPEMRRLASSLMDDPFGVMTSNGKIVSEAMGLDNDMAEHMLALGATGAGITGTGPATAAVFPSGTGRDVMKDLDSPGDRFILTTTRCRP